MREAKTFFDFSEMDFNSLWDENIISEDDYEDFKIDNSYLDWPQKIKKIKCEPPEA